MASPIFNERDLTSPKSPHDLYGRPPIFFWFNSEVYFWRSLASICWSVICFPSIVFIFLLMSNVSIIHPFNWLYGSVLSLFSIQCLFSLGVCTACLVLVTWFSLPHFTVSPDVDISQLASALGLLRFSRLPLMVVCMMAGIISSWCLSRLCDQPFQGLSHLVETDTYARIVLNEHHLFLVLSGIVTGLAFYISFFQRRKYYLYFNHVQRYRLQQIRNEFSSLFYSCVWQAINVLKYFYITYFLFGSFPKSWIENSFKLSEDPKATAINSFRGILSVSLLWQTFLCVTCITFAWSLASAFIRVFHTEPITFPVISDLDSDKYKTLPDAIGSYHSPLLQHLALLDLRNLSRYSHQRRLQLISLSQPGGHPRTWVAISSKTLQVVRDLSERVRSENWAILSKVSSVPPTQRSEEGPTGTRNGNTSLFYRGNDPGNPDQTLNDPNVLQPQTVGSKALELLKGLPFVSQILAESPEYNSRMLFSACQPQIWAVEGISEIASKAYNEDKYGVVQTALPAIIGVLLDLHEVLEKHLKLTASVARKSNYSTESPPDILLKQKLFSSNKSSIYRIVNTYRDHLSDIRISAEHTKKIQPFTEYLV